MQPYSFRIVPLPTSVAEQAREGVKAGASDHALIVADSANSFPCRHCQRWAEIGERVILFPFVSIPIGRPYTETGPIFVHADSCPRYSATGEYPDAFRQGRVLRAYDAADNMIETATFNSEGAEAAIEKLLANPQTAFLQARSVDRGCYTFRIERR